MKRWSPLAVAVLVASTAITACTDDRLPSAPRVPLDPQFVINGPTDVTDEYTLGDNVHGAIFTTTFNGGVVNENVHYGAKTEVYLDGGPRNPNSQAAGLPDGLYVFQITDPPGKVLLSMDPAVCRVVQVDGGVIVNTVAATAIPGLGAAYDTYDGQAPRTNPVDTRCHVEDPAQSAASAAYKHDINTDTEAGGGTTVQMWPFHDTPNPGGVYKAWMIPLKAYLQNRTGGTSNVAILYQQTATVSTTGPGKKVVVGYAPDPGFKNPSRRFTKTDNFKVTENPPFIRISKIVNGQPQLGWPVTVYEVVNGEWIQVNGWLGTVATFSVPLGADVRLIACEKVPAGYAFVSATVGGQSVNPVTGGTPAIPTDDGGTPAIPIVCVSVPGFTSGTTVDVVFTNAPVDARISIAPLDDTNGIGEPHTLTGWVEVDPQGDGTFENAPAGTRIDFSIVSGPGTLTPAYCLTLTTTGQCTVTLNSSVTGTTIVRASTTVTVAGSPLYRQTGPGVGTTKGDDARKVWVDGSLVWEKVDGNDVNIGGATFQVRRTHDRFGVALSPNDPMLSVPDNVGQGGYSGRDTDVRAGYFKVEALPLGRYCVKETAAPAGYLLDPVERCENATLDLELTITDRNGDAGSFVNSLPGRMTGGTGKVELDEADKYLTSGFTIHCDIKLSNNVELNWPGNKWHIDKPLATAVCIDDPNIDPGQPDAPFDTFRGTAVGSLNGVPGAWIEFTFIDDGEPGKESDKAAITVWSGAIGTSTKVLEITLRNIRGNVQAHEDQPHRGKQ